MKPLPPIAGMLLHNAKARHVLALHDLVMGDPRPEEPAPDRPKLHLALPKAPADVSCREESRVERQRERFERAGVAPPPDRDACRPKGKERVCLPVLFEQPKREAPLPRLVERLVHRSAEVVVPPQIEVGLARLERAMVGRGESLRSSVSVRRGVRALRAHTWQQRRPGLTPRQAATAQRLARQVASQPARLARLGGALERWLNSGSETARRNVQAYVQRVLREAYLIQSGMLMSLSERMDRENDVRKRYRDLATEARGRLSAWAARRAHEGGDERWSDAEGVPWAEVNETTGEEYVVKMTEEDVRELQELQAAQATAEAGYDALADYQRVTGPTQLTPGELEQLRTFAARGDNYIRDHFDELSALLPKVTVRELEIVIAIFMKLIKNNRDEKELRKLLGALSPMQTLILAQSGVSAAWIGGGSDDRARYYVIMQEKLDQLGQVTEVSPWDYLTDEGEATQSLGQGWQGVRLDAWRDALDAHFEEVIASQGEVDMSLVGTDKLIHTVADLEAYIKHLEERLNGLGEDSQLRSADMQSMLQQHQLLLQLMSNVSKMLHDSSMSVVRKMDAG